jgi:3-oxoadipate enol-lactonase
MASGWPHSTVGASVVRAELEPLRSAGEIGDDAIAVGRAVLGERFHVAGTSVGGMAALWAAVRHPDHVRSLTLIATSAGGAGMTPPDQAYLDNVMTPPDDPDEARRENLALALSPGWPEAHPERFEALVADLAGSPPVSDAANAALVEVFLGHDVSGHLAQIAAPTLVIGCEHDLIVPISNSEYLAAHIPSARLVRVPTGHAIDIEAPDRLVELIVEHVSRHATR